MMLLQENNLFILSLFCTPYLPNPMNVKGIRTTTFFYITSIYIYHPIWYTFTYYYNVFLDGIHGKSILVDILMHKNIYSINLLYKLYKSYKSIMWKYSFSHHIRVYNVKMVLNWLNLCLIWGSFLFFFVNSMDIFWIPQVCEWILYRD